jgi:alkylation response protein AidB-like acyl-CoA dehydrogenase
MDLRFTEEDIAFRREVREFFATHLHAGLRRKLQQGGKADKDELVVWTRTLNARGWATPHWPVEWGGTGWSPVQQMIFRDELQQFPAPEPLSFGVSMVASVIYTFGTQEQKKRFLPRIANLDDWWRQGFSEPGAGSDLAGLKTTARRDGDHYIVNGQKTWTTLAQYADWIFVLARTDPTARKQKGISFLLIDMKSPGVTLRPIQLIDGGVEVNEIFLDDVRVPSENLVGEENKGWDYAKFLLTNERNGQARVGLSKARLRRIRDLAASALAGGAPLSADPAFKRKLAWLEIEAKALEMTVLRVVDAGGGGNMASPIRSPRSSSCAARNCSRLPPTC